MKLIRIFFLVIILISNLAHAENKIKIGVALAQSGEIATFCVPVLNGINLAMSELKDPTIEIVIEDDQGVPSKTASAVLKLISVDKVSALITCTSGTSKAVAGIAERNKVPMIAIATDPEIVKDKKYVTNLWVTPEAEVPLAIDEIVRRGYKKIARISTIHDGSLAFKKIFDQLNEGHVEIVLDEDYDQTQKDFRTYLAKLKSKGEVDGIFLNLFPGQNGIFAKQTREFKINSTFFAFELLESEDDVKLSQGALIGSWYVQASSGMPDFISRYKNKYPKASSFASANGYDAIGLIRKALESDATNPADKINYLLHNLKDYTGALGTFSSSGDNRFTLPAVIKEITKDGFKELNK